MQGTLYDLVNKIFDLGAMEIREEYRIALEVCPTPLMLVSRDGDIVLCNERFAVLFGYETGELHNQSVDVLVPEEIRKFHPELRQAFFEVPTSRNMGTGRDLYGMRKDGELMPVEIGLDPITTDENALVMVSVLDIRERKMSEVKIRRAIDAALSAMVMIDEHGKIELVNEQANIMFGYENQELIGHKIETLVPQRHHRKHTVYRASYQNTPNQRFMGVGRDLFGLKKDGTEFPVEIGLTPLDDVEGRLIMATVIDITERKENEKNIRTKNEELQRLNNELTEFAYSASHDLKAPLSSIFGLLELSEIDLSNGDLEELRTNLSRARMLAQRLSGRIEDMLTLARTDHLDDALEDVSIPDLVSEASQAVQGQSSQTPSFTTAFDHSDPIRSVPLRLSAILENLLANAYKYSDPEKPENRIHVTTWDEGDVMKLAIEDNGIGIPEDHLGKIFKLFKRVANSNEPGSGLGLALVEKNLTHMGGSIEVVSSHEGSCFTVTLPQNREAPAPEGVTQRLEIPK